ncbi:acetyl-CoA C-acetyltransferase [Phytohabitans sp. ZYX-F-186]|uniref:Acetyl-CoA C-acetyltransferase n=1 Tax=Phytohabitans maris TaxID=3071409 RepID=A0ABU0Z9J5_9ACTN|nr:acetyl-CoA C-acetyltransferase [Phytohabitans sp. ZYX-F-186]MDQ7903718.1 acetyl-CoA C-acetyltransferase [Phytohabitans sp. ZYX-F-186]
MPEAYIVDAIRTPVGRKRGGLRGVHPADLGAHVLRGLVDRVGLDARLVDDVVFGCVDMAGPQTANVARTAWLAAGLPEEVPAVSIDRQCGSSQQAVHFAAQAVLSGTMDLVVAGGVENMSMVPIGSAMVPEYGWPSPFEGSRGFAARYAGTEVSQLRSAELVAEKWGLTRDAMEQYALESHRRAVAARDGGRFAAQILPIEGVSADEGPRADTSAERLAALQPVLPGGRITAGLASQISDGAAALLVASETAVERHGLRPRARIHHLTVRGDDPVYMLTAPISATRRALDRTGLTVDDIDVFEINEAFASVPMAWLAEIGADPAKTNPNGGAIALGHPLGATGARIMTSLLGELERTGGRYGLQTMCEGGGLANVTIIERLA